MTRIHAAARSIRSRFEDVRSHRPLRILRVSGAIARAHCLAPSPFSARWAIGKRTTPRCWCRPQRPWHPRRAWSPPARTGISRGGRYGLPLDAIPFPVLLLRRVEAAWCCLRNRAAPVDSLIEGQGPPSAIRPYSPPPSSCAVSQALRPWCLPTNSAETPAYRCDFPQVAMPTPAEREFHVIGRATR